MKKGLFVTALMFACFLSMFLFKKDDVSAQHKAVMKKFETMINTNDKELAKELVSDTAPFYTPASPTPLYGGAGYLSVVDYMRTGFSDIQWKIEDMVAEGDVVAVRWNLTATHDGLFMGLEPTGTKISTTVMNFYYFNDKNQIVNDIAAEGMIGILRPLGLSK